MPSQVVFVAPAAMTANGTADLNQVERRALGKLSADYELSITAAAADDVFKAFLVAEGTSDSSADLVVNHASANEAIVKAALDHILQNATDAESLKLSDLMEAYVKTQVEGDLSTTGLLNILEAEMLINVVIPDATVGAAGKDAMWGEFASGSNAMARAAIATQLPYDQYSGIPDGGNLNSAFAAGDSLVLNFVVTSRLDVNPVNEWSHPAGSGSGAVDAAQGNFNSGNKSRTFNITITKSA